MRVVRFLIRVYCRGSDEPEWSSKNGNFSHNAASLSDILRCVAVVIRARPIYYYETS